MSNRRDKYKLRSSGKLSIRPVNQFVIASQRRGKERERDGGREGEREIERETERQRQTDRQTDRQRQTERERQRQMKVRETGGMESDDGVLG